MTNKERMEAIKAKLTENNQFQESKTPIGWSFLAQLIVVLVPGICLWIFLGPDFKTHNFNAFSQIGTGNLWLIMFGYLMGVMVIMLLACFAKLQKVDCFTFALALSLAVISVILNGLWVPDWTIKSQVVKVIIRFVIAIILAFGGLFIGSLITAFARNIEYKISLKKEAFKAAYQFRKEQKASLKANEPKIDSKLD